MLEGPLPWLASLLVLYLLVPVVALLFRIGTGTLTALGSPGLVSAVGISATAATISAAVMAVCGIPLGYVLSRGSSRWHHFVGVAVQLPLALPPLASGILVLFVVGPYTALGRFFHGALTDSLAGIVLAQTFVAAPFLIVAARSSFAAVDPTLDGVAATLGHRALARFFRVSLPLAWPGILAGLLLAWVRAFGEFGATAIVAYHPTSLPIYTYMEFGSTGLTATLPPVFAALVVAMIFLALGLWRPGQPRRRRPVLPEVKAPRASAAERPGGLLDFSLTRRLRGFVLSVEYAAQGRRVALLGPSGSGKSLTLRLLAGLDSSESGWARLGGRTLDGLPAERRGIGYVPQDYGLFPHLPVWSQLTFGVGADPGVAHYWLVRLGLRGLEARLPSELSGGQRQRVALARALAHAPDLLLLDEPFAALDAPVRGALRREMRALQRETGVSTLLVTHDPVEVALLADEVLVLENGRLLQAGAVAQVFQRPASAEVARLLGVVNLFSGEVVGQGVVRSGNLRVRSADAGAGVGRRVTWSVRPEDVRVDPSGDLEGRVEDVLDLGGAREAVLDLGDDVLLTLRAASFGMLQPGDRVRLDLPPEAVRVWPEEPE